MVTCPPDLEGVFEELANATTINNNDNVLKGAFEYMVDANLSDTNDWYLDYVGGVVKPFVLQMRKKPTFVAADNPDSPNVFMKKKFLYGSEARYNVGYALWQFSIMTTNS
jgi:phage major head subunit gpT-like protein